MNTFIYIVFFENIGIIIQCLVYISQMWHIFSRFHFLCLFILWLSQRFSYQQMYVLSVNYFRICLREKPIWMFLLVFRLKNLLFHIGEIFHILFPLHYDIFLLLFYVLFPFYFFFVCAHFYSYCENLLKHTEEDKSCANKHVRYRIKSYNLKLTGKVCCLFMEIAK